MSRKLLSLLSVLLLASTTFGVTYVLKYKDGREVEVQKVTKVKEGYQVVKGGISYLVESDKIASIEERATPMDEYKARLDKIDKTKAEQRYKLARWAYYNKKLYQVALDEAKAALKIDPKHTEAKLLRDLAKGKLKAAKDDSGDKTGTDNGGGRSDEDKKLDKLLIGSDDIYRIRLLELDREYNDRGRLQITERTPIQFRNNVRRRFTKAWAGKGIFEEKNADRAFLRSSNRTQAAYMLQVLPKDSPMLKDIRVTRDPQFITTFERQVWPLVRNIIPEAFSEKGVSGLRLIDVESQDPRLIYSNFVLLDGYAKGRWRMIDRGDPRSSLLLQWGLPRDVAKIKNPNENYEPVYRSRKDPKYRAVYKWIAGLESPHPKYNLKYKPPYGNKLDFGGASILPPKDGDDDEDEEDDENPSP
jgi:tetratricopeptide (TPR) repeat protein